MRYAEYALLLIPVGVVVAWFYGIRGLTLRGLAAFLLLYAMIGSVLYWFGAARVANGRYVPAHMLGGRIVPGHWNETVGK